MPPNRCLFVCVYSSPGTHTTLSFVKEKRVSERRVIPYVTTIYYSVTLHSTLNVHNSERIYSVCYNYFYIVTLHSTLNTHNSERVYSMLQCSVTSAILRTTRTFSMCFHNVFSMKQSAMYFVNIFLHSLHRLHGFSKKELLNETKEEGHEM